MPRPPTGRVFETSRRVRVADADPSGRLRLDAVARFVQDVGSDDVADAGFDPDVPWVIRRSEVTVAGWPRLGERVSIASWCGGTGGRWAERRVTFSTDHGVVDVATLVVHLDAQGRPARLPDWFGPTYAEAAQGRTLTSRLTLPGPPEGAGRRPWPLRSADLDVLGHVNNAVTWAALEDEWSRRSATPTRATVEWSGSIEGDDDVELVTTSSGAWLCVAGAVRVAAAFD